jgi:hypothetical protein
MIGSRLLEKGLPSRHECLSCKLKRKDIKRR